MTAILDASSPLVRYGHNLTELARTGFLSPLDGQEAVVDRMFQILVRTRKNNLVIISAHAAKRKTIVMEAVRRIAVGDAPDTLLDRQVVALNYDALFADLFHDPFHPEEARTYSVEAMIHLKAIMRTPDYPQVPRIGYSEKDSDTPWTRLKSLLTALQQTAGSVLLFIDHFHLIVGGEWELFPLDGATLLAPLLARWQIQLIAGCTLANYDLYIMSDASLQRRFQEIFLAEPENLSVRQWWIS